MLLYPVLVCPVFSYKQIYLYQLYYKENGWCWKQRIVLLYTPSDNDNPRIQQTIFCYSPVPVFFIQAVVGGRKHISCWSHNILSNNRYPEKFVHFMLFYKNNLLLSARDARLQT